MCSRYASAPTVLTHSSLIADGGRTRMPRRFVSAHAVEALLGVLLLLTASAVAAYQPRVSNTTKQSMYSDELLLLEQEQSKIPRTISMVESFCCMTSSKTGGAHEDESGMASALKAAILSRRSEHFILQSHDADLRLCPEGSSVWILCPLVSMAP